MANATDLLKRFERLASDRTTWDSHWSEVAQRVWPEADEFITQRTPGEKVGITMYDSTPALALEKLSAVLEYMLTPRNHKWSRLRAKDERLNDDDEVTSWLEDLNDLLFAMRNRPGAAYYSQKHETYKSLGAFGNGCEFVEADPEGGVRYQQVHIGQAYTEINDQGRVDTMFRKYPLSAKAAAQKWGKEIPEAIQADLNSQNPWKKKDYLHVVVPKIGGFDSQRADELGMPFEAYDLCIDTKDIIRVGGYRQFPYTYARYTVNPRERYGRGPIMFLLPTIKTLNAMMKTHLKMGQRLVAPPLLAAHDGIVGLGRKKINMKADAVNWGGLDAQGNPRIAPLMNGGRLDLSFEMMAELRAIIEDACLARLWQVLVEHPQMTATQVLELAREKGILMAPMVGRIQAEMLGPQVEREADIVIRQGLIRRPPASFMQAGGEYEIEYESEATRMQGAAELIGIQRTIESVIPFAQADPTVLAGFKPYEILRRNAEVNGVPMEVIRTREELEEYLEEERQKQEAQTMAGAVPEGAKAVRDLAAAQKDFSEVPPPPGG